MAQTKERKVINLSEEEFDEKFTVVEFNDDWKFETYGEDLEIFQREIANHPNTGWTMIDSDDGEDGHYLFVNRVAAANRISYFVTEEAYDPNVDIVVNIVFD